MNYKCSDIIPRIRAWLLARTSPAFDRLLERRKRELLGDARGVVLEIGPGTGSNLRYLPPDVSWIGVEPNRFMHRYALAAMERLSVQGEILEGRAENIPLKSDSVDTVISSLVLCSVGDPLRSLREINRVLKPGGQFLFIEHVAAKDGTWLRRVQKLTGPIWHVFGDGCCPGRKIASFIEGTGFNRVNYEDFVLTGGSAVTRHHIAGRAKKSDEDSWRSPRHSSNPGQSECCIIEGITYDSD